VIERDLLLTIAEVSVGLAGFSAIVPVLVSRFDFEVWTTRRIAAAVWLA
jgi:hypothetical protein